MSRKPETTATAIVSVSVSVVLDQPWTGDATLAAIQKRALQAVAPELKKRNITVGGINSVRVVLNEERLS